MLQRLEQANLFVVSLDHNRQWYRYHPLFAEALHSQMQRTQSDLAPMLHYRASIWYAQNGQITEAILHAFNAHKWEWAADLIERLPLLADAKGEGRQELIPPPPLAARVVRTIASRNHAFPTKPLFYQCLYVMGNLPILSTGSLA